MLAAWVAAMPRSKLPRPSGSYDAFLERMDDCIWRKSTLLSRWPAFSPNAQRDPLYLGHDNDYGRLGTLYRLVAPAAPAKASKEAWDHEWQVRVKTGGPKHQPARIEALRLELVCRLATANREQAARLISSFDSVHQACEVSLSDLRMLPLTHCCVRTLFPLMIMALINTIMTLIAFGQLLVSLSVWWLGEVW